MQAEKENDLECPFCNCMETYPLVEIHGVVTWCCVRCACTFVPARHPTVKELVRDENHEAESE